MQKQPRPSSHAGRAAKNHPVAQQNAKEAAKLPASRKSGCGPGVCRFRVPPKGEFARVGRGCGDGGPVQVNRPPQVTLSSRRWRCAHSMDTRRGEDAQMHQRKKKEAERPSAFGAPLLAVSSTFLFVFSFLYGCIIDRSHPSSKKLRCESCTAQRGGWSEKETRKYIDAHPKDWAEKDRQLRGMRTSRLDSASESRSAAVYLARYCTSGCTTGCTSLRNVSFQLRRPLRSQTKNAMLSAKRKFTMARWGQGTWSV